MLDRSLLKTELRRWQFGEADFVICAVFVSLLGKDLPMGRLGGVLDRHDVVARRY